MPDDLAIADIQQAFLEYRANFEEPITIFWAGERQAQIVNTMYKALSAWHVGLENIAWRQGATNLRDVQLTFGVPSLFASIQVGIAGVTMTAFNPDWSRAPLLIPMFQTGLEALKSSTGHDFQFQQTTLGFHVKPAAKPFREIVAQFVNASALGSDDAAMFGVSVYKRDYSFVIDSSAAIPGGVFIKLIRNFPADNRLEEMAKILHSDEEAVLRRLGLRLQ